MKHNRHQHRASLRLVLNPSIAVASVGGVGFSPFAPGTAGTLLAFPLFYLCAALGPVTKIFLYLVILLIGLWAVSRAGLLLGNHDHPAIVIDETIAMALAFEFIPGGFVPMIAAFVFFRLFDILKVWPANFVETRFHNVVGVIGDDLIAAIYAAIAVWTLQIGFLS